MSTIEIKNISKHFGKTRALNSVSLAFAHDKIYGILGRNGAGKTTLLNIITNKVFASAGDVLIDGERATENDRAQSKIYCMSEQNIHPGEMKVKEGFAWAREFYPSFDMEYAQTLAQKFNLDTEKRIKGLSTGYNTIFKLILTLASSASILIFDEPTLALDASSRETFYGELLKYYGDHPKLIIISSHLIDELAEILEEVIILKNGEIRLAEPVEFVLSLAYTVSGNSQAVDEYCSGKNVIREESIGRFKSATIFQKRESADRDKIKEFGLETTPGRLQELFVSLTKS